MGKTFEIHYEFKYGGYAEVEAESLADAIEKFSNPEHGEDGLATVAYRNECEPEDAFDHKIIIEDCLDITTGANRRAPHDPRRGY